MLFISNSQIKSYFQQSKHDFLVTPNRLYARPS